MRADVVDLGELAGPLILFGGPYSNRRALEALFALAKARGIAPQAMICTGDLCSYGAEPETVVTRIAESGCVVVAGNTDEQLGAGVNDCGCGFEEGSACDLLSARWFAYAAQRLSLASRAYLSGLPSRAVFRHAGRRFAVIHGGASAINRFIWSTDDETVFAHEINLLEGEVGPVDRVIAGHSGAPFIRAVGDRRWINAGTIGMGAHDGDPRGWFGVLEDGEARLERLDYDRAGAAAAMRAAGLPEGYAAALETGWWPNEDVLPPALRRSRGTGRTIKTSSPTGVS